MKVIFLDNDGVICLSNNWGSRFKKQKRSVAETVADRDLPTELRFDNFDQKAINVLNEILEETGAEIVVSSDWKRWANLQELGDYYEAQGICKRPVALTDLLKQEYVKWTEEKFIPEDFEWDRNEALEQERHFEILHWLKEHPEVTHWVAVDDLNMGKEIHSRYGDETREWGLTNFVWTPLSTEGIKQAGKKEKILKYLQ
jgi:hypothetical protein